MRSFAPALLLSTLIAVPACSQTADFNSPSPGNPGGMAAGTVTSSGMPAAHRTNNADRIFVYSATHGGLAEVQFANLAQQRASYDGVKAFARQMAQDHGEANRRLAAIAKADALPQPNALDADHQMVHERLRGLSGADFDTAYIQAQIVDHQATAQLLEYEINSGQEAELRAYAQQTLPVVLRHLEMAKALAAQMNGQAGPLVMR